MRVSVLPGMQRNVLLSPYHALRSVLSPGHVCLWEEGIVLCPHTDFERSLAKREVVAPTSSLDRFTRFRR